jgi:hypothetical protein
MVELRLILAGWAICCAPACSDPGTTPERNVCGSASPPELELGSLIDDEYQPFAKGDDIPLIFASQAAREARVSLRMDGFDLAQIDRTLIELMYDGYPLAWQDTGGDELECVKDQGVWDTAILVDVGSHPTVSSVVQVEGETGLLVVTFFDEQGEVIVEQTQKLTITL